MRKGTWPKIEPAEQVKRAAEAVLAVMPHPFGRGDPADDRDARDPRRPLPNGTWAPRGPTIQIRDLDDWPWR
jgi:hypothetical protein